MVCLFVLVGIWVLHYTCHLFGGMSSCLVADCWVWVFILIVALLFVVGYFVGLGVCLWVVLGCVFLLGLGLVVVLLTFGLFWFVCV